MQRLFAEDRVETQFSRLLAILIATLLAPTCLLLRNGRFFFVGEKMRHDVTLTTFSICIWTHGRAEDVTLIGLKYFLITEG